MKANYPYDRTIDDSQQRSLEKVLSILEEQQKEYNQKKTKKLTRPKVSVVKGIIVGIFVSITILILLPYLLNHFIVSLETSLMISLVIGLTIIVSYLKAIIQWLIRVYQKLAPDNIRLACVFEPSCSEYMLLSIEKYGVYHGVFKGIKRLLRCHYPNGGIDNP